MKSSVNVATLLRIVLFKFAAVSFLIARSYAADFYWVEDRTSGIATDIVIEGQIEAGDYDHFLENVLLIGSGVERVQIYSPGGSVDEAIKIGIAIRELKLSTWVPHRFGRNTPQTCMPGLPKDNANCLCLSSCVLVYLGGIDRFGDFLGIHRAFLSPAANANLSLESAMDAQQNIGQIVKNYVRLMGDDVRFKNYGLAPKSAADFAFLLHGFHFLKDEGVMAIILPHGVLFRGGAEERIRTKLLKDGHIDTVIGLPANLFYSTGIPVCILVLKKCKKPDDVLFINAAEHFVKGKRQNQLTEEHIAKIIDTYKERPEKKIDRYARRVGMDEIEANAYNLNISRYISTAEQEIEIDLSVTHKELVEIEKQIRESTAKHNAFLKELGLAPLPGPEK